MDVSTTGTRKPRASVTAITTRTTDGLGKEGQEAEEGQESVGAVQGLRLPHQDPDGAEWQDEHSDPLPAQQEHPSRPLMGWFVLSALVFAMYLAFIR